MTKRLFILFIQLCIFNLNIHPANSENLSDFKEPSVCFFNFTLSGDVLSRLDSNEKTKLYDKVAAISHDKDILYYIRTAENKWITGFFTVNSNLSTEFEIQNNYEKLYKFAGYNGIFYYLVQPVKDNNAGSSEHSPVLIRFNPDRKNYQSIDGVVDFVLLEGKSLILKNNFIDYNGLSIPILLTGKLKISEVIDSRIAVISGESGTEIVDIIAGRSIYQYKGNSIPDLPDEYNVILEFADNIINPDITSDPENSIYYEIQVDGVDENRTETGRGELSKTFYTKLDSGEYHILRPERWELDKSKGRYSRMNNIYQPSELKIYVPENRILKIRIEFNGTGYSINQSVLYK